MHGAGLSGPNPPSLPIGLPSKGCVYRPVAKKKVASKKSKVTAKTKKKSPNQGPLLKEVGDVIEELEHILSELRTSTVRYSRDRIERVIARLKALGEQ